MPGQWMLFELVYCHNNYDIVRWLIIVDRLNLDCELISPLCYYYGVHCHSLKDNIIKIMYGSDLNTNTIVLSPQEGLQILVVHLVVVHLVEVRFVELQPIHHLCRGRIHPPQLHKCHQ